MEESVLENRVFKFWFYQITHSEAIIRSGKKSEFEKNIDIYFGGIKYIEIPTILSELKLEAINESDMMYLEKKIKSSFSATEVTVLVSGEHRYYVVATVKKIFMNELEMLEVPIDIFVKGMLK